MFMDEKALWVNPSPETPRFDADLEEQCLEILNCRGGAMSGKVFTHALSPSTFSME